MSDGTFGNDFRYILVVVTDLRVRVLYMGGVRCAIIHWFHIQAVREFWYNLFNYISQSAFEKSLLGKAGCASGTGICREVSLLH